MPLELPKATLDQLAGSVRRYVENEMEVDCGEAGGAAAADFVVAEVGPAIYNHAMREAASFMQERVLDLEAACHEPEMPWWHSKKRR
ncbi:MAG: DUF2164 family protein [Myxococcota bacterium]